MPLFEYKAMSKNGLVVKNKIEETNRQAVIDILKRSNLLPITVTSIDKFDIANIGSNKRVKTRDILVFTQNLYLLKKANFNNIHALKTIIKSTENNTFKKILKDILSGVESGENMYKIMQYYSNVFPKMYINMIKVGELSDSMEKSLEQAIKYLEDKDDIKKRVRKILIPNLGLMALLIVLLFVGTIYGVPAVEKIYKSVGSKATLPKATLMFKNLADWLIVYWYIPLAIIFVVIAIILIFINTDKGKYKYNYFKYKMPLFGKLNFAIDFTRFIKAMELNINNGAKIEQALKVSRNVVKNQVFASIIESSINNLVKGNSWIEPFEKSGLASPMIIEMLKIGMDTDLSEMMAKLINYMEIDIEQILQRIKNIMPEFINLLVGIVLIFFVVIIIVPAIQVYMGNFLFDTI